MKAWKLLSSLEAAASLILSALWDKVYTEVKRGIYRLLSRTMTGELWVNMEKGRQVQFQHLVLLYKQRSICTHKYFVFSRN